MSRVGRFEAVRLSIDVGEWHRYACDWFSERVDFFVDGALVRSCANPPGYPMQLMVAVFDFPERSTGDDNHLEPEFVVDWIRGCR